MSRRQSHTQPTEGQHRPLTSENPDEEELSETLVSPDAKKITQEFSCFLLMSKSHEHMKIHVDGKTITTAVYDLADLVHSEGRCIKSLTALKNNADKVAKATAKGLFKEFGSPDQFLFAALTSEQLISVSSWILQRNPNLSGFFQQ